MEKVKKVAKAKAEETMVALFEVKRKMAMLKQEEQRLAAVLDDYAIQHEEQFQEGQLQLRSGVIKVALNPAKLVKDNGSALSPEDKVALASALPEYCDSKPNAKLILENMELASVGTVIERLGFRVVQESKFAYAAY